ncbi:MAG: Cna B-type domain-containing protein, partial [Clostridiales bacterium]|nr:Cna B-type domain-containing protein [Clostridiales bacterium]
MRLKFGTNPSSTYHADKELITLKASEGWRKVVEVERQDSNGRELHYSVEEVQVNNFTPSYSESTKNYVVTNTFNPTKATIGVSMGVEGGNKDLLPREIEVKVKDAWSTEYNSIQKIQLNAEKTEYSGRVSGYNVRKDGSTGVIDTRIDYEIPGYRKVQGKYQYIVNNIQKTVRVEKENGKDNIPFKIYLKQNGVKLENTVRTVKAGSTETFSVPETKFADGSRYTYTLEHEETPTLPEGYSVVKVSDELIKIKYTSPNITVNKEFTVTNGDKTNLPQTVSVTINNNKG